MALVVRGNSSNTSQVNGSGAVSLTGPMPTIREVARDALSRSVNLAKLEHRLISKNRTICQLPAEPKKESNGFFAAISSAFSALKSLIWSKKPEVARQGTEMGAIVSGSIEKERRIYNNEICYIASKIIENPDLFNRDMSKNINHIYYYKLSAHVQVDTLVDILQDDTLTPEENNTIKAQMRQDLYKEVDKQLYKLGMQSYERASQLVDMVAKSQVPNESAKSIILRARDDALRVNKGLTTGLPFEDEVIKSAVKHMNVHVNTLEVIGLSPSELAIYKYLYREVMIKAIISEYASQMVGSGAIYERSTLDHYLCLIAINADPEVRNNHPKKYSEFIYGLLNKHIPLKPGQASLPQLR